MTNQAVLWDLDHQKKRLEYYRNLKVQSEARHQTGSRKPTSRETAIDRWIEIYQERVQRLERQVAKLKPQAKPDLKVHSGPGLKTRLASSASKSRSA